MTLTLSKAYENEKQNSGLVEFNSAATSHFNNSPVTPNKSVVVLFPGNARPCTVCIKMNPKHEKVVSLYQVVKQGENQNSTAIMRAVECLRKFIWHTLEPMMNIPSSLRPCVYVRISLLNLLPRGDLFKLPSSQAECLAGRLLIKGTEPSPPAKDMVWMRICPQKETVNYEFYDPAASDLVHCGYIFGRIIGYNHKEGMLYQFSSPSFSGKKAMSMIWNFMAMSRMENILFTDVSTILACCETGALTSLHLAETIMKCRSWYATQGATSHISKTAFKALFNIEFIENRYERSLRGKLKDRRIVRTIDYDQFSDRCLTLYLESQTSKEAYRCSRHFLHQLKVEDLHSSTSALASSYPELGKFSEFLTSTSEALGRPKTVGSLLAIIMSKGHISTQDVPQEELQKIPRDASYKVMHELMHDVRDRIVSNKDSIFFQHITDVLRKSTGRVSYTSCAFAFLVLDNFLKKLKGLSDPVLNSFLNGSKKDLNPSSDTAVEDAQKPVHPESSKTKIMKVIYNILQPEVEVVEGVKNVTKKVCGAFLRMIENRPGSPVSAKICSNSNRYNREKWMEYSEETGISDELSATQIAIQYIASLPLNDLSLIYPDLIKAWESRYPMIRNNTWRYTVADLIDALQVDEAGADELFDDLFRGAIKHLSQLSLPLFNNYKSATTKDPKSAYELFMISKYLCKRTELFALYLPSEGT